MPKITNLQDKTKEELCEIFFESFKLLVEERGQDNDIRLFLNCLRNLKQHHIQQIANEEVNTADILAHMCCFVGVEIMEDYVLNHKECPHKMQPIKNCYLCFGGFQTKKVINEE